MASRRSAVAAAAACALAVIALSACQPEPTDGSPPAPTPRASSSAPVPSPPPSREAATIPLDCESMLSADVRAQLSGVPLNDPAFGSSGAQADGGLICIWADPAADPAGLTTTITYLARGPALDTLNGFQSDGYACYPSDGGTRCEKTWFSEPDLLPAGRTLFWRDDILIDTRFADLAPDGYTAAIVAGIFG